MTERHDTDRHDTDQRDTDRQGEKDHEGGQSTGELVAAFKDANKSWSQRTDRKPVGETKVRYRGLVFGVIEYESVDRYVGRDTGDELEVPSVRGPWFEAYHQSVAALGSGRTAHAAVAAGWRHRLEQQHEQEARDLFASVAPERWAGRAIDGKIVEGTVVWHRAFGRWYRGKVVEVRRAQVTVVWAAANRRVRATDVKVGALERPAQES